MSIDPPDRLLLGWSVDANYRPKFFGRRNAVATDFDLFHFSPEALQAHTILFAQSGSGKSTLVSRLIEEVAKKTRARILIFDPNSDYRYINQPVDSFGSDWNSESELGNRNLEDHKEFAEAWKSIVCECSTPTVFLKRLDPALLLGAERQESNFSIRSDFQFLTAWLQLLADAVPEWKNSNHSLMSFLSSRMKQAARSDDLTVALPSTVDGRIEHSLGNKLEDLIRSFGEPNIDVLRSFILALSALRDGLVTLDPHSETAISEQAINVLDLATLDREVRYTFVCAWLDKLREEHEMAFRENRIVPTLIFIDEAHNLAPRDTQDVLYLNLIRDRIRWIAAEGRKYGLFLTLISQRPDKLDPLTVSECENRIVMRVASTQAINDTASLLGLNSEQRRRLESAASFKLGRAFALGPIAYKSNLADQMVDGIVAFYGQPRRTRSGAPNILQWWGKP